MAAHWIEQATSNTGALHRMLGVPVGQKIGTIDKATNSGNPLEAKRARLAKTLAGLRKK